MLPSGPRYSTPGSKISGNVCSNRWVQRSGLWPVGSDVYTPYSSAAKHTNADGHATVRKVPPPLSCEPVVTQAAAFVGSVELRTSCALSTARQSVVEAQETPRMLAGLLLSTCVLVQPPALPPGSVAVNTSPYPFTAAHRLLVHETPNRYSPGSMWAADHALLPPAGSAEVSTRPTLSTATQLDGDEHEIAPSACSSTSVQVQVPAPSAGLLDASTSPARSTATHSEVDGQDTSKIDLSPSTWAGTHACSPFVGSVEVITFPSFSTATQKRGARARYGVYHFFVQVRDRPCVFAARGICRGEHIAGTVNGYTQRPRYAGHP